MNQELKGVWDTLGLNRPFSTRDRSVRGPIFLYFPSNCRLPDADGKSHNKGSTGHVSWLLDENYISHAGDPRQIIAKGKTLLHTPWSEERISSQSLKYGKNPSLLNDMRTYDANYLYAEMGNKLNANSMASYAKTNIIFQKNIYAIADTEIENGGSVETYPRNNCITQVIELFLAGLSGVTLSKEFVNKHTAFKKLKQGSDYRSQVTAEAFNDYTFVEQVAQLVTDYWTAH